MMPHLSGLDVLAAMRTDERWRDLPCIILTAAGQEQQHTSAMELGANDFFTKPFSPKKLYARAAELVGIAPDDATAGGRMSRWAVVLAGGVGSRFWPLSTPTRPKQLLPLVTQRTAPRRGGRAAPRHCAARPVLILTNPSLVPADRRTAPRHPGARTSSPSRGRAGRRRRSRGRRRRSRAATGRTR